MYYNLVLFKINVFFFLVQDARPHNLLLYRIGAEFAEANLQKKQTNPFSLNSTFIYAHFITL